MSLIKNITKAVKNEVRDYVLKMVEIEKENSQNLKQKEPETETTKKEEIKPVAEPEIKKEEPKEETKPAEKVEEAADKEEIPAKKEKREIVSLIEPEFIRFSYKKAAENISISFEIAELVRQLPLEEYALFMKLYLLAAEQKKNYGYWSGSLKRKIGLDDLSAAEFNEIGDNLAAYGLLLIERLNETQRTFVLYIPFDEENMVKLDASKQPAKQPDKMKKNTGKPMPDTKKEVKKETEPVSQHEEDIPGKHVEGMEDDEMYKSYKTFVSLEIDKAKMRVGRANFDKIYMEAVKYIDKKYGFKVLSDSDKFKEYLTNYYISAFDIPTFENWKKSKG